MTMVPDLMTVESKAKEAAAEAAKIAAAAEKKPQVYLSCFVSLGCIVCPTVCLYVRQRV